MNRRKFYTDQLVDSPDIDAAVTNIYNGVASLLTDVGITGIISGGDVTERATPSMSVDLSGPFISYDQSGDRVYKSSSDVVDCSQDYLGSPTVPTGAGEKVWISIWAVYAYTEEDAVVIGDSTYYRTWADSYEWRVVAGTPATGGSHTKPALPSDALLVADIELEYGQTTILTADIDESRKMVWQFTDADKITVDGSGFTKLDTAIDDVQEALDAIDVLLISRDGSGDIDQHLLPDGGTRDLGSAAKTWGEGHISDVTIYGSIAAAGGGEAIGDVTNQFEAFLDGLTMYGAALPNATGVDLGSTTARFDAFLEAVKVYGSLLAGSDGIALGDATNRFAPHFTTATIYTKLAAAAGGEALGDSSNQFAAFLSALTYYGALSGTLQFDSAESVTVMIPISDFTAVGGSGWDWNSTCDHIEESSGSKVAHIRFNIPDGVTLTSMRIRWAMANTGGLAAQIESVDEDNAPTSVGASKTITTYDGTVNWDTIASGLSESGSRADKYHRVKVTSSGAIVQKVYMLEATFSITDILLASLKNCS